MLIQLLLEEPQIDNPEAAKAALSYHVCKVINSYVEHSESKNFDEQEIEALDLPSHFTSQAPKEIAELSEVFSQIQKKGLITEQSFNIFLASCYSKIGDELTKAHLMQARIILASVYLSQLEGYGKVIKRALDACRLIFTDHSCTDLLLRLPHFTLQLDSLITQLNIQKKKGSYGKHHITSILALFKNYRKKESKYRPRIVNRNCSDKSPKDKPDFKTFMQTFSNDNDENMHIEFSFTPTDNSENNVNIDSDERLIDQKTATKYFAVKLIAPKEIQYSLSLQNQLVKTATNSMFRREKQLACDYRQLTRHDVSNLILHCMANLGNDDCYSYLLVMLFTGRSLKKIIDKPDLLKIAKNRPFDKKLVYFFEPSLPKHEVEAPLEQLFNRPNGKVILVLPDQLTPVLSKIYSQQESIERLNDFISNVIQTINSEKQTRLTLARIINYLSYYLNNRGNDASEIALLLEKNIKHEPGCSYYQINIGKLMQIHQDFILDLMKSANQTVSKVIEKPSQKTVGSWLQVKPEILVKMFGLLSQRLLVLRNAKLEWLEEFHNLYTIYIINLLNLSTGHRPVCNPYETIDCFDLVAGTVFISDKEIRSTLSARVVVMPKLAIDQISNYLKHLTNIRPYITNINLVSGQNIDKSLAASGPLFFFLNNTDFIPVTPSNLEAHSFEIWPIRLNWHRHFMRTWLRNQGVHGHIVDAWMGHVGVGGDSFARYSALGIADLSCIALKINAFFNDELKLQAEPPWSFI
jgi:hypothetical protein